jgi:hypothetical protein
MCKSWRRVWTCVALLAAACGADKKDDPKDEKGTQALDRSMPFDDLDTIGEALCAELNHMVESNPEFIDRFCIGEAVVWAQQGVACEDIYEDCLAEPFRRQALQCEPEAQARDFGCPKLTVGMYLDCQQQRQNEYAEQNQDVTCATSPDLLVGRALLHPTEEPTGACKKALDACPSLFD